MKVKGRQMASIEIWGLVASTMAKSLGDTDWQTSKNQIITEGQN